MIRMTMLGVMTLKMRPYDIIKVFDSLEIEWLMGLAIRGIPKTMDIIMMLMVILILLN
jgi:hypothetical protein